MGVPTVVMRIYRNSDMCCTHLQECQRNSGMCSMHIQKFRWISNVCHTHIQELWPDSVICCRGVLVEFQFVCRSSGGFPTCAIHMSRNSGGTPIFLLHKSEVLAELCQVFYT